MSKIALTPNASGSGTFTIASPNSNTDRTLTLPDEAGTVLVQNTSGNVGIGTTSPDFPLEVYKATTAEVAIGSDNGGTAQLTFYENNSGTKEFFVKYDGTNNNGVIGTSGDSSVLVIARDTGNVGIGTTSPSRPLDVHKTGTGSCAFVDDTSTVTSSHTTLDVRFDGTGSPATGATYIRFGDQDSNNGSITVNGGSVAYNTSSDYRKKENIVDLTDGIDRVKQLDVHRFNWIGRDETVDGFLAHEVQTVVPEAVTGTKDEVDDDGNPVYQGIDQAKLVPLLTGALQEAIAEIESLKARVEALETP